MADGFLTGVSSQPLDVVSGGQAFLQSAVDAKLKEIEAGRAEVSENAKNVLKAISVKTIEGLSRGLQQRYQQEIEKYRGEVVDKFRKSGGKLSMKEQMEIQNGFVDLNQRMVNDVSELKKRDALRNIVAKPEAAYAYDLGALLPEMAEWDKAFDRGEYREDPMTLLFKHQLEPSTGDYVAKRYAKEIGGLNILSRGEWINPTTFRFSSQESEEEVDSMIGVMFEKDPVMMRKITNPDGSINQEAYDREVGIVKNMSIKLSQKDQPFSGRSRSGGGGTSNLRELYPTQRETHRGVETWYNWPSDVTQTKRTIPVKDAYDPETGKKVPINKGLEYIVVSFTPDSKRALVSTSGGTAMSGDEPLLYNKENPGFSTYSSMSEKEDYSFTPSMLKKQAETMLIASIGEGSESEWEYVSKPELVKNEDGSYTMQGTVRRKDTTTGVQRFFGKERPDQSVKRVSIDFEPLVDKDAERLLELDLNEYRGVLSPIEKSWKIEGQSVTDILNTGGVKKSAGSKKQTNNEDPLGIM